MSATISTESAFGGIQPEQRIAARVAGGWYLFAMAAGIFAEIYARRPLIVPRDAAQTVANIAASEGLFRLATLTHLIVFAGDVVLLVCLFTILKTVSRPIVLLAAAWRLMACAILAVNLLCDFAILQFIRRGTEGAIASEQVQAFVQLLYRVEGAGFQIGFFFLGLGSAVFSLLWFRSRYIPRPLAALGIFASLVMAVVTIAVIGFPALSAIGLSYMFPMFVYEVGLGFWLLIKGIRPPAPA